MIETEKLKSVIESILFISGEPVKLSRIVRASGAKLPEVENAIMVLLGEYQNRGMIIIKKDNSVQMATNPQNSDIISNLVKSEIQEGLSNASMEVLSIVAYRGPVTRVAIEAIRGVNSSFTLRTLLMRGLLERIDNPNNNRSYLYRISFDFLKKIGLESQEKLPDFETLSKDSRIDNVIEN